MLQKRSNSRKRLKGFGIVELMVGVLIGLLSTLIVMKVSSLFSDQKNTTSANADAQENGLMAIAQIEQGLRNAGSGFAYPEMLQCGNTFGSYNNQQIQLKSASFVPATIVDGGANGSDRLVVPVLPGFLGMIPATLSSTMANASDDLTVTRTYGFAARDVLLVVDANGGDSRSCSLLQISSLNSVAPYKLRHVTGAGLPFNSTTGGAAHAANSTVYNLGNFLSATNNSLMFTTTYSLSAKRNLQMTFQKLGQVADPPIDLSREIVSMQAQYGIAPVGSHVVNQWVEPTGSWAAGTISNQNLRRIKAIRVVLVARSGKKNATDVTAACTSGAQLINANGPCPWQENVAAAPKINLAAVDADWKRYRYRIYQTVIPLRNILWADP